MTPEELLKLFRDNGMEDEAIMNLLSETLASLKGPAEEVVEEPEDEEKEKERAGKLLGVAL